MSVHHLGKITARAREVWPLIPAAFYLFGSLCAVLLYLVGMSLTDPGGDIHSGTFPTFTTYSRVLTSPEFREALGNTLALVLIGTPLELLIGLALSLLVFRAFRFQKLFKSILLIPLAIPALVTATLLLIIFDFPGGHANHFLMGNYSFFPAILEHPLNWRGSKAFALGISLLGKVWRDMPISMLIILAGLLSIDPEYIEAARSMGAGWRQRLRFIILPLLIPSMAAVVLLRSIEMWKEFIFPFVLAGRHSLLGTLIESLYNGWGHTEQAAAVAVILVFCILLTAAVLFAAIEAIRRLATGR